MAMDKAFLKKYIALMLKVGVKSKLSTAELEAWDSSWSSTSSATSTAISAVNQSGAVNSSTEPIDTAVEARKEGLNVMRKPFKFRCFNLSSAIALRRCFKVTRRWC